MAAAGQPLGCLVEVSNFGAAPVDGVRVTLAVDGGPPVDETMLDHLNPGQARTVRLGVRFPKAGYLHADSGDPGGPPARRMTSALWPSTSLTAWMWGWSKVASAATKQDRDAFFLVNALVPTCCPPGGRTIISRRRVMQPAWLQEALPWSRYRIIFLSNVGVITPNAALKTCKSTFVRAAAS